MNDLKKLVKELNNLTECLGIRNGFEFLIISNKLKIITPFLFENNDHIEIYLYETDERLFLTDDSLTSQIFYEFDNDLFKQIAEKFNIDINSYASLIKKIGIADDIDSNNILRKIIDFSNDLQRIESVYLFLKNNKKIIYNMLVDMV